jgi:two-component system chemotaxis response regulator CheB
MDQHTADVPRYIIVVGASAGGLHSVIELSAQLTPEMDAAMFVVLHISKAGYSDMLVQRVQRLTSFTCKQAEQDEPIKSRHIYLAVPDQHLLVKDGRVMLGQGPPENRWRPSIDILFRSAAAAYDSRAIGIVLSGMMQDGTSGMIALKRSGGTCIVQDPAEAEYADMPQSVIDNMEADYVVSLAAMGSLLAEKMKNGPPEKHPIPDDILAEAAIAEKTAIGMDLVEELGDRSAFVCPECGGGLWEMHKDHPMTRFRCYTGHSYNLKELLVKQREGLESTLWMALRMLEERKQLLKKMSDEERNKGWIRSATSKAERQAELEVHINRLKELLFDTQKGYEV